MPSIADTAGKMIGPLPLGAWVAVVGVGVGVVVWQRNTATTDPTDNGDSSYPLRDNSMEAGVGVGGSGMWTDLTVPTTSVGTTDTTNAITTNEQWYIVALNRAIADGIDPITAAWALNRYLSAQTLDSQGDAIVRDLMRKLGAPPQAVGYTDIKPTQVVTKPVAPTPVVTKPVVTAPVVTKRAYLIHRVQPGDTMTKVANLYKIRWLTLYNANRVGVKRPDGGIGNIKDTAHLTPGTWLVIPNGTMP